MRRKRKARILGRVRRRWSRLGRRNEEGFLGRRRGDMPNM